jgi:hypothetical protein
MKRTPFSVLVGATLVALGAACGPSANEARRPWPKPTPPPDASPIYHDVQEHIPTEEEIEREAREHPARLESGIEGALRGGDAQQRETAFVFMLPELLQVEPGRAVALHARLDAGGARDQLRTEIARQWIGRDLAAAVSWMKALGGDERRAAVVVAATELAPYAPREALQLVETFGYGREESLRKLISTLQH